jgi:heme/copper-type cytochrome/quinol oxidase subunit 4
MTLKSYLWGIRLSVFITLAALILVLRQIDPEKSGIIGQLFFYVSTFLFFAALLILFFTWLRRKIGGDDEDAFAYLGMSFRQGVLMSLLIVGLLILQQYRVLVWWDGLLSAVGIFLIELYFLTRK